MKTLDSINLVSLNVRFDTHSSTPVAIPPSGSIPPHHHSPWSDPYAENPWCERRSRLVDALLSTGQPDILGFQEVLHNQLLDLSSLLGERYGFVGVGRDDGKEVGEYAPVFWRKGVLDLVRWKTVWLSPTPDVPGSKGWDASQTRIATIVTLSTVMGELVHVVNTHYDDQGKKARAESSLIIREHVKKWVDRFEHGVDLGDKEKAPVILLGDFNSPPEEEGYEYITSPKPLPSGTASFTFLDTFTHFQPRSPNSSPTSRQSAPYGPIKTYTGFTRPGKTTTTRIDFIMLASDSDPCVSTPGDSATSRAKAVKSDAEQVEMHTSEAGRVADGANRARGGWEVVRYACIDNWVEEGDVDGWTGRWSDHRAVRVTIERV